MIGNIHCMLWYHATGLVNCSVYSTAVPNLSEGYMSFEHLPWSGVICNLCRFPYANNCVKIKVFIQFVHA